MNKKTQTTPGPSILAPAGSTASFLAAIAAGADAVYCGLKHFSARMEAKNFTLEELIPLTRLDLKLSFRRSPQNGTPVFLVDRREKELEKLLSKLEGELIKTQGAQVARSTFRAKLPKRSRKRAMAFELHVYRRRKPRPDPPDTQHESNIGIGNSHCPWYDSGMEGAGKYIRMFWLHTGWESGLYS
ncbi:MAG: hypothetical protein JRJ42_10180 [Deltaproteobacteria bacterium]|nr:hypothetical protein [Deltaproteobacteria bacterium]MBW2020968.1 hypothetical protein [Deltaproteobacteria bacterium]MBW2075608.1 hypothetical protein [Deltaproteobacteria bacterium]